MHQEKKGEELCEVNEVVTATAEWAPNQRMCEAEWWGEKQIEELKCDRRSGKEGEHKLQVNQW